MVFELHPTPVPAPERVARPVCATRTGTYKVPQAGSAQWATVPVREYPGRGWVSQVDGPVPVVPVVNHWGEVDFADQRFANGFIVTD